MTEPIHFNTDLYRRDALELAAEKYQGKACVELADSGADVVVRLEPRIQDGDSQALRDEFCTEAFSATVKRLRDLAADDSRKREHAGQGGTEPPWELLAPFTAGAVLGLGWVLESLGSVRAGAATMVLRHARDGIARVTVRRNHGAPRGVAHTDHLDFMLMNGGGGTAQTDDSIERVLIGFADTLRRTGNGVSNKDLLALLLPHADKPTPQGPRAGNGAAGPRAGANDFAPRIDIEGRSVCFDFDESSISRPALYDAVLAFADRCYVFLTRPDTTRLGVQLKARGEASADVLAALAQEVANKLNQILPKAASISARNSPDRNAGLPHLSRQLVDIEALLTELESADAAAIGLGFQPERGPGHEDLRVLNIRGTGACNSECVFCIEKFNPTHRPMPKADATRQLILDASGQFDMLFFASGEPTIHPKLFEYVELARSVGFTCFGMSSHFRTFSDPRFTLKILQAGFEYFDISLHAADAATQLEVNPIGDDGYSLLEALKGLAVLYRLAEALGIRVSVTQKIVVSRLNVTRLERIFRATYDRGVRHFILQPVRTLGLAPELQAKLAISEEGILPHLNELLRRTEGLGAVLKPYGFSRQGLYAGSHVESEQNRVKNIYGKTRRRDERPPLPTTLEERPTDGRHWVEVRDWPDGRFGFASDGSAPVLDDGLQRGLQLNFGCRMGSCGMCCARLLEGRVDQSNQVFLTDEQIREGFVLMCQARPLSDVVLRVCTEDEIDQL
jgi:ferredoxin